MAAMRGNNDDEEQSEENLKRALIELEGSKAEKLSKRGRFLYSKRYHFDEDFIPDQDDDNNNELNMSKRRYLRSKRSV